MIVNCMSTVTFFMKQRMKRKTNKTVLDDVLNKYQSILLSVEFYEFRESIGTKEQKECWFGHLEQLRSLDGGIIVNILLENNVIRNPVRTLEEYESVESLEHHMEVTSTEIFSALNKIKFVFDIVSDKHKGRSTKFTNEIEGAVYDILKYFVH